MTIYLRQSTASQEVLLGPFVDSTDGNTAETALSVANTDIKLHKAGATTLASKNSGGATHISNGNYYAVLDATDTDTAGTLAIVVQVSGALAVRHDALVLPPTVYDALIGGGGLNNVRKNSAFAGFTFLLTDSTNHAPATGKTVTVTRSIDGGAFSAGALSAVTEVGVGLYKVDFAAADLNGNCIVLRATATGCDDTFERIITCLA